MDSNPHPQVGRSLSTSSSSGSLPIRAPITLDDFNTDSGSDSGFESDKFTSVDGFETASERPFVADPDDENVSDYVSDEGEESVYYARVVDNTKLERVMLMPVAKLSMDDDDDDYGDDEEVEEKVLLSEVDDDYDLLLAVNDNKPVLELQLKGDVPAENGVLGSKEGAFEGNDSGNKPVSTKPDEVRSGTLDVEKEENQRSQVNGHYTEEQSSVKLGDTNTLNSTMEVEQLFESSSADSDKDVDCLNGRDINICESTSTDQMGLDGFAVGDTGDISAFPSEEDEVLEISVNVCIGSDHSITPIKPNIQLADPCEAQENDDKVSEVPMSCINNENDDLVVIPSVILVASPVEVRSGTLDVEKEENQRSQVNGHDTEERSSIKLGDTDTLNSTMEVEQLFESNSADPDKDIDYLGGRDINICESPSTDHRRLDGDTGEVSVLPSEEDEVLEISVGACIESDHSIAPTIPNIQLVDPCEVQENVDNVLEVHMNCINNSHDDLVVIPSVILVESPVEIRCGTLDVEKEENQRSQVNGDTEEQGSVKLGDTDTLNSTMEGEKLFESNSADPDKDVDCLDGRDINICENTSTDQMGLDGSADGDTGEVSAFPSEEDEVLEISVGTCIASDHSIAPIKPNIQLVDPSEVQVNVDNVSKVPINCINNENDDLVVIPSVFLVEPPVEVELHNPIAAVVNNSLMVNGIEKISSPKTSELSPAQEITQLGIVELQKDGLCNDSVFPDPVLESSLLGHEVKSEAYGIEEGKGGLLFDEDGEGSVFGNSEIIRGIVNELKKQLTDSYITEDHSLGRSQGTEEQTSKDSYQVEGTGGGGEGNELFDTLATIMKETTDVKVGDVVEDKIGVEEKRTKQIQLIRVKFLRLVQRLGLSPQDPVVAQVLYQLVLNAGRHSNQAFTLESAKRLAEQLEVEGKNDLDFSLNILVIGKTGVGKSATVNSIFGEDKVNVNAFEPATAVVKEIVGTVDGVKIRVLDTPGLRTCAMEQNVNRKILASIQKFMKRFPPDVVLYVDRLDTRTKNLDDLPLLNSITSSLGSSIWQNVVIALTHAALPPPDGPSGSPLTYDVFVSQRFHVVRQAINQATGNLRLMGQSLMHPVSLVENHLLCEKNRYGQRMLPNGQTWKPLLLLFCYSMKILSEANSISRSEGPLSHQKLFGLRARPPPLPYILSSLLQSRTHPKLSTNHGYNSVDSDIVLGDLSNYDEEEDHEYDQLPPFKPLQKCEISKLSKEQRKAYFEEYDYRVQLLEMKQWVEEVRRLKKIKKNEKSVGNANSYNGEGEDGSPEAIPVALPDMVLPPTFDGDNPAHRYRFLESMSQLLARPVMDSHGWDHDCGYDGLSLESDIAIFSQFPAGIAVQITKDKKEFNIHLSSSVSGKHGENGSTMAGLDIQTMGRQLAYILRGDLKVKNLKTNKTSAGVSVTFQGENVSTGFKVEDEVVFGKRFVLMGSTGAVQSQGDTAYGANLEMRLKEKGFPIGQDQSSLSLSLVNWRGDLAMTANLLSQFSIGRNSKMAISVGLNNKRSGQINVRISSSEKVQVALLGILPLALTLFRSIFPQ